MPIQAVTDFDLLGVGFFLHHLKDIDTTTLAMAVASAVEHGQHGKPSVADIRRRAGEIVQRRSSFDTDIQITERPENQETVARLRAWNYCEHEISEALYGNRPVPNGAKQFSEKALKLMGRVSRKAPQQIAEELEDIW